MITEEEDALLVAIDRARGRWDKMRQRFGWTHWASEEAWRRYRAAVGRYHGWLTKEVGA